MTSRRWGLPQWMLLGAGCLGACRRDDPEPPPPAPVVVHAGARPDKVVGPPTAQPIALSVFVPRGDACDWTRLTWPGGRVRVLATLESMCHDASVALSPDGQRALVWMHWSDEAPPVDPEAGDDEAGATAAARHHRLWLVDLRRGVSQALHEVDPAAGELQDVGFGPDGTAWALTWQWAPDEAPPADAAGDAVAMRYGGVDYRVAVAAGEAPGLAHAFRLDNEAWTHAQARPAGQGANDAEVPLEVLDIHGQLAPRSHRSDAGLLRRIRDSDTIEALGQATPEPEPLPDAWGELVAAAVPVAVGIAGEAGGITTRRVLVQHQEQWMPLRDLSPAGPRQVASVAAAGRWLLVSTEQGARARLFDLRTQQLVWVSHRGTSTTFWPDAARVVDTPAPAKPAEAAIPR